MELAEKVKSALEEKLCPVHDVHPAVEIIGDEISIACCCTYFQSYCTVEAKYLWSELSDKSNAKVSIQTY